jgi:hypothetical protein
MLIPFNVVFAIKYQDKEEIQSKKAPKTWYYQQWYFRTKVKWMGASKGTPPPPFVYATVEEKEAILNNLKPLLKDYLK